jgi:transposase
LAGALRVFYMTEAWIQLLCPECGKNWEDNPAELSAPSRQHTCRNCGLTRYTSEFTKTKRDLEILESFQE